MSSQITTNSIFTIKIKNCNNIDTGEMEIKKNKLNIKYGINGTGKSTIAKAIQYTIENHNRLNELTPFKNREKEDNSLLPEVEGLNNIHSIKIFNDSYVDQYIFQPNELIKNSFDIFIRTPEYDNLSDEINALIVEISNIFKYDEELNTLILTFKKFLDGCGRSGSDLAKNGFIYKALKNGNKIDNIPKELNAYQPYLQNKKDVLNLKWLQWQTDGHIFLDVADTCPFCANKITENRTTIKKVAQEFDIKSVEHLMNVINLFESLSLFLSNKTNEKIKKISSDIAILSDEHREYIFEIKKQIETMHNKLESLKYLDHISLHKIDKTKEYIEKMKIDLSFFSHLQSEKMNEKVIKINNSLDTILSQAGLLQGKINIQKRQVEDTIKKYHSDINSFLLCAGYSYSVSIEEVQDKPFHLLLKHNDLKTPVDEVRNCLSFGERNAFALALFMYSALKDNSDLIILDDPLSSFDGNKRFAILNLLFMGKTCLKNNTVLVLTHEFNFVIDCIYNLGYKMSIKPHAYFISTVSGKLEEKPIEKQNIISIIEILLSNIKDTKNILCKCVYLRRYLELLDPQDNEISIQLLSNLFKKRKVPQYILNDNTRDMNEEEISSGSNNIKKYISNFDYTIFVNIANDKIRIKELYESCECNYEKLHLYRIINNKNSRNDIIRKYINETFHIENDSLFQLNPKKYSLVPQFIIDECDNDIKNM